MADLVRFVLVLLLLVLLIFIQGTRFLVFNGINPNLILIFFLGLILIPILEKRIRLDYFLTLLAFSFFVGSFIFDFWIGAWLILSILVIAGRFFKRFLTGYSLIDFLIMIGANTLLFYLLLKIFSGGVLEWSLILSETVYNLVLGAIFWYSLRFLGKYMRR